MEYLVTNSAYKKHLFEKMYQMIAAEHDTASIRYLWLGNQVVRVLCYAPEILQQIDKQLTYVVRESADNFDATIIAWQEADIRHFLGKINEQFDLRKNMRLRIDILLCQQFYIRLRENMHLNSVLVEVDDGAGRIRAYDNDSKTYFVAWRSMDMADLMQDGHLFVQQFYRICNTPKRHLVHGAVAGLNGVGVLFGARGGRGKSTLTVRALLDGFDYVSDDYLLLDKTDDELTASPIYSIITLSPKMSTIMGTDFVGDYLSENARKDKGVFNIAAYHKHFRINYPIKMLMFPRIVPDAKPSIEPVDKGQTITQLIHSTILQTGDIYNTKTVRKLLNFLKEFPCYQINLCPDISENVQYLRQFLTNYRE
jgi:hypothetical protein